jgi:type IV pilus assembly protein PilV
MPRRSHTDQPRHALRARGRAARGVAMVEVLVSMLLISLWMLSSAGLQLGAIKIQKSADSRLTAVALVGELAERMEANNRGARTGDYLLATTSDATETSSNCAVAVCQPSDIAAYDLAQWTARAAASLKSAQFGVADATPTGGIRTYTITVSWQEPRGRQTYTDSASAPTATETMSYVTTKVIHDVL